MLKLVASKNGSTQNFSLQFKTVSNIFQYLLRFLSVLSCNSHQSLVIIGSGKVLNIDVGFMWLDDAVLCLEVIRYFGEDT